MKTKWKNVRDQYLKSIREGKSGDAAKKKRRYLWSASLEFLRNSMEKRETSGNIDVDDIEHDERKSATSSFTPCITDSPVSDILPEDSLIEDPGFDVPSPSPPLQESKSPPPVAQKAIKKQRGQTRRGSIRLTPFQSSLLNQMDRAWNDQDDPDRMYLLSLLPTFTSLSQTNKWKFRQLVANFFMTVEEEKGKFDAMAPSSTSFQAPQTSSSPCYISPLDPSYPSTSSTSTKGYQHSSPQPLDVLPTRMPYTTLLDLSYHE